MDELIVVLTVFLGLGGWLILSIVRRRRALERKQQAELPNKIDEYISELDDQLSDDDVDSLRKRKGLDE